MLIFLITKLYTYTKKMVGKNAVTILAVKATRVHLSQVRLLILFKNNRYRVTTVNIFSTVVWMEALLFYFTEGVVDQLYGRNLVKTPFIGSGDHKITLG